VAILTKDYVAEAKQTEMDSCPSDAREAYNEYLTLLSGEADLLSSHPHIPSEDEVILEGFLNGLAGDVTTTAVQEQEINVWFQQVRARWSDIQTARAELTTVIGRDIDSSKAKFSE